jgi:cytochrome P450
MPAFSLPIQDLSGLSESVSHVDWIAAAAALTASGVGFLVTKLWYGPKPPKGLTMAPIRSGGFKGFVVGHTFDDLDHHYGPGLDAYEAWCKPIHRTAWIKVITWGMLITSHPADIDHMITSTSKSFIRDELRYGILKRFLGTSQLLQSGLDDDVHAVYRREFGAALTQNGLKTLHHSIFPANTYNLIQRLRERASNGAPIAVEDLLGTAILGILTAAIFHASDPTTVKQVSEATRDGVNATFKILRLVRVFDKLMFSANTVADRSRKQLQQVITQVSTAPRSDAADEADAVHHAVLDLMLQSKKLKAEDILDNCLTLLGGGYGTALSGICSLLYFLSNNLAAQEKLFEEVSACCSEGKVPPLAELQKCSYLKNCVNETLRLQCPISTISRQAVVDTVLPGTK